MKKFILFLIVIISLVLVSCSRRSSNDLIFAVGGAPAELDYWETLIADFTDQTGIRVQLRRQPTDTDQRRQGLVIALKSKQSKPDVFLMDVAWIAQFAASNWLEPLQPYLIKDEQDTSPFFQNVINLADTYEKQLIALPIYIDSGILYYRKDLLLEHGITEPPQTWQELLAYSKLVQNSMRETDPSFYGFVWQGAQYEGLICNFLEFAGSNKGGLLIENKKISLNNEANRKALELMRDLIHKYDISPLNTYTEMKEEEVRSFFQQGHALFERNWPYAWALHNSDNSQIKDQIGIAPLPHFGSHHCTPALGGWHVGLSYFSKQKKQAWEFIQYLTSFEVQKNLALSLGWNPGRKDVYQDKLVLKKNPHFIQLQRVFKHAVPRPNLPYYTRISEVLQKHINSVLANKVSIPEGLMSAEKEAQVIINLYED